MTDYQNNLFCIPVHSRKQGQLIALVDRELFPIISEYRWHLDIRGYARTKTAGKLIWMHRMIINIPDDRQIDHINGDTLNNTKANLRLVDNQLNQANRNPNPNRRYKGVFRNTKIPSMFEARIGWGKKSIYLGLFRSEQEAAAAYDQKAIELYGKYARLNFPRRGYQCVHYQTDLFMPR